MTATPSPSTPQPSTRSPTDAEPGEISYADAQAELDAILHELDGDEVDVDVLGARVRRAAELLRLCRSRIAAARFEVEQVVGELEAEADLAAAADDLDDELVDEDEDEDDLDDEPEAEADLEDDLEDALGDGPDAGDDL